jgi:hypothetical protein
VSDGFGVVNIAENAATELGVAIEVRMYANTCYTERKSPRTMPLIVLATDVLEPDASTRRA